MFANAAYATILITVVIATKDPQENSPPEILFTGKQYLKYIPSKSIYEVGDRNKLAFRFRTVHPSGLLLLLAGKKKIRNDGHTAVLCVQLIQGYVSYSLSQFGKRQSEILIYGNFNDDQWHQVTIIRTNAISEVRVDQHTKTLISPSSYAGSSFQDYMYIGGYDFTTLSPKSKSLLPMFVGCLQLFELDDRDPIRYYYQGSRRIEVKPKGEGLITGQCKNTEYSPIEFTKYSSSLVMKFPEAEDLPNSEDAVDVSFAIRTFSSTGVIFQTIEDNEEGASDKTEGMKLVLFDKSILFKMWYFKTKWEFNLQMKSIVANGLWHNVEVKIKRKDVMIRVDNQTKKQKVNVPFELSIIRKKLRFGGTEKSISNPTKSFIGCLNSMHIQKVFYQDILGHDDVIAKSSIKKGCTLLDRCFPDPCLNGGICQQEKNAGKCDCSKTEFYGKFCEKPLYKPSCAAYQKFGLNETSYCLTDSDGSGPLLPSTTLCKFSEETKEISTVVRHNKDYKFFPQDGDETFQMYTFHYFNYELDLKSIKSLIEYSKHCRQRVSFKCYETALLNAPDGPTNVGWLSGSRKGKSYWGAVPSNSTSCECGLKKDCVNPKKLCNCDAKLKSWHEDSGYVTNKEDLPILRLDVIKMANDRSKFFIGPLECFGMIKEKDVAVDTNTYIQENLLSKACVSVATKVDLIRVANDSVKTKLHKEKPLLLTTSTPVYSNGRHVEIISKSGVPVSDMSDDDIQNELSIVEIVFIVIAALSTLLLLVKFVFCTLFHKLYGQITLNHEQRFEDPGVFMTADTLPISSTSKKQNGNESTSLKGCVKVPSNYWV